MIYICRNCGGDLEIDKPSGWWTHVGGLPEGVVRCSPVPVVDEYFGMPTLKLESLSTTLFSANGINGVSSE